MLTECWLREADFCLSPAKPDYLSTHALQFLQQFGRRDAEMGFSESLGVVISMKDAYSAEDEQFDRWLRHHLKDRCFEQTIPRAAAAADGGLFQRAAALLLGEVSGPDRPRAAARQRDCLAAPVAAAASQPRPAAEQATPDPAADPWPKIVIAA